MWKSIYKHAKPVAQLFIEEQAEENVSPITNTTIMIRRTITQLLLTLCFITGVALFAACSSENEPLTPSIQPKPEQPKEGSTQVKTGNLTFNISELPFGADTEEETRATQEPEPTVTDTVELCEGVEAEITLERDRLPATRSVKHGMSDGNYRVFAYQNGVSKGMFTFIVSGGNVTFAGHLTLPPGVYSFYCCNEHVGVDNNKFTIPHSNVGGALIGFAQNVYVGGSDDKHISFAMTHVGGRIRTKVSALMPLPGDMRSQLGIAPGMQSYDMTYDLVTDQYQYTKASPTPLPFPQLGYTPTADVYDAALKFKTSMCNDYTYFISHMPLNEIVIRFTNGSQLYRKAMNTFVARKLSTGSAKIDINKSYTLNIKFIPNFRYLFHDGSVDYLRNKGGRIPIALVIADHMGMALTDAAPPNYPTHFVPSTDEADQPRPGNEKIWSLWSNTNEYNTRLFAQDNSDRTSWWKLVFTQHIDGAFYTWDPAGSTGNRCCGFRPDEGALKIKGNRIDKFPAFYWSDLHRKSLIKRFQDAGIAYNTTTLAQGKWFLPTVFQWMYVLEGIGMGNHDAFIKPSEAQSAYTTSHNQIINYALTKAGGTSLWNNVGAGYHYWTSVEWDNYDGYSSFYCDFAYTVVVNNDEFFYFGAEPKGCAARDAEKYRVRSFVKF